METLKLATWRLIFAVGIILQSNSAALSDEPVTVVVLPFQTRGIQADGADIGKEFARLLCSKISDGGVFNARVVESEDVNSSSLGPTSTAKLVGIARRERADFILSGTVKEFKLVLNPSSPGRSAGAPLAALPYVGGFAGVVNAVSANMARFGKVNAFVEVKLVNAATGKEIFSADGNGESRHLSTTLWDRRQSYGDFVSKSFAGTAAGEAANAAEDQIASKVREAASTLRNISSTFRAVGIVKDVDKPLVCLGAGTDAGLDTNTTLSVDRPIISDTNEPFRVGNGISRPVGKIILVSVSKNVSLAKPLDGANIMPGDYARKILDGNGEYDNADTDSGTRIMVRTQLAPISSSISASSGASSEGPWKFSYDRGVKLFDDGRYAVAQTSFMSALRLHPPPEVVQEISDYLKKINEKI